MLRTSSPLARGSRWLFGAALLSAACAAGCSSSSSAATAPVKSCSSDADCKNGRVCDPTLGACVDPVAAGGAGGSAGEGGSGGGAVATNDVPAATQCTVVPQGGCPAGHTCAYAGSLDQTSCYSAGSAPPYGACTQAFDCAPGSLCLFGGCAPLCTQDADCAQVHGARCKQALNSQNQAIAGYRVCSSQCNPASPSQSSGFTSCGQALGCDLYPDSDGTSTGATICAAGNAIALGQPCESTCAASLVCLKDSTTMKSSCAPYCLKDGSSTCSGSCRSFGTPQFVTGQNGMVEIGYCG